MNTDTKDSTMKILKTGTCASVSGKSKLTYEVALGEAKDLQLRISKNSGTGYFSATWVAWDKTWQLLEKSNGKPVTSHTLSPLYKGRSVNTAGFLLAVLLQEGVVQRREDMPRYYELLDPKFFLAQLQAAAKAPAKAPAKASAKSPTKAAAKKKQPQSV